MKVAKWWVVGDNLTSSQTGFPSFYVDFLVYWFVDNRKRNRIKVCKWASCRRFWRGPISVAGRPSTALAIGLDGSSLAITSFTKQSFFLIYHFSLVHSPSTDRLHHSSSSSREHNFQRKMIPLVNFPSRIQAHYMLKLHRNIHLIIPLSGSGAYFVLLS
jgi:hypothetical protein